MTSLAAVSDPTDRPIASRQPFPWYGIDIGGTLVKVVYFEPTILKENEPEDEIAVMQSIHQALLARVSYTHTGVRDAHLEIKDLCFNGYIGNMHFLRFPTHDLDSFIEMAKEKSFSTMHNICHATGGGTYKFGKKMGADLSLNINKLDEIDCLISGINFIGHITDANDQSKCFSIARPLESGGIIKVPYNFKEPYPYVVCNIGSGVSFMAVTSPKKYKISGTTLGGSTFVGLCCLLTGCKSFEEAIELAVAGDSKKVNELVCDVYGKNYNEANLRGDAVASSFGKMTQKKFRDAATKEDLAAATLLTITNNIGEKVANFAQSEGITKILFVGNFLRENEIGMKLLANAINFWSRGPLQALFVDHQGYFGAVGALLATSSTGV